ncbi:MAG: hypothetical protein ABII79_04120 [bacterium]
MFASKYLRLMVLVLVLLPLMSNAKEVMSLNPLFTEKDVVVEPMIEGTWYDESGSTIVFSHVGDNFYHLVFTFDGSPLEYEAVLIRIAGRLICDIFPQVSDGEAASHPGSHIRLHTFYDISVRDDTMRAAPVSYEWYRDMAVKESSILQYSWIKEGLLLTGSTEVIREMFFNHCNDEGFFGKPDVYEQRESDNETSSSNENVDLTVRTNNGVEDLALYNFAATYPGCEPGFPYSDGWLGGDAALSIPISRTQNLWVFSDTFVGMKDQRIRKGSHIVTNTIAISTCDEEQGWQIEYYWGDMYTQNPKPFFESYTDRYKYWPREVFAYQDDFYVALSKVGPKLDAAPDDIFSFSHIGSSLAKISNFRTASPDEWIIELIPWSAVIESDNWSFLAKHEDHLYIFFRHPEGATFLLRVPLASLAEPEEQMEYLATDMSWQHGFDPARSRAVMKEATFGGGSLHYHEDLHQWVAVYGPRFLDNRIFMLTAPDIIGPWSEEIVIYAPPELIPDNAGFDESYFCYAAREHIQFYDKKTKRLLITYDCNSSEFGLLLSNMEIYYPRVISIPVPK